ncbi:MAG TPA: (5-formylfuran-3-yl)methyl phosphate synthase [Gemmatimonadales bacterium]|jgi:dihydroneopterin aldolase|nr:(5-formylfuran-3-yl)methyl phosphate synthase [Gemmatimonadales bacterium]
MLVQLLVSVRSAAEAASALAGGADVIDAKEPALGALGAVAADVLAAIDLAVPSPVPLSVALGDVGEPEEAARLVAGLPLRPREAPVYAKLALPDRDESRWAEILGAAVLAAANHAAKPRLIAAVYADLCTFDQLLRVINAAVFARAGGALLDTATKDGRSLLDWLTGDLLKRWADTARTAGLLSGLAGSVNASQVPVLAAAGADVMGVRGAACDGGRTGTIDVHRVAALRQALESSAYLQATRASAGAATSAWQDRAACKAPHQPVPAPPRATA